MIARALARTLDRDEFEALLPEGWALSWDAPITGFRRQWDWRCGQARVALVRGLALNETLVILIDAPALEAHLEAAVGFISADDVLLGLRVPDPTERLRAVLRFGPVFAGTDERPDAMALIAGCLCDPDPSLRWAAVQALDRVHWPGRLSAFEAAAASYPEMAGPAEMMRRWLQAMQAKNAQASVEAALAERMARLEALVHANPAAVLDALEGLSVTTVWRWRSRAWAALDRPTRAWIAHLTSIGLGMGEYHDDDPAQAAEADAVALPGSGRDVRDDGLLIVLGDAVDALEHASKHKTIRALLAGLTGQLPAPLIRFAQALVDATDHEGPAEAALRLATDYADVPEAWWIRYRSLNWSDARAQAQAAERQADAWLGLVPAGEPLTDTERGWIRARVAVKATELGAAVALVQAAQDWTTAGAYEDALRVATRGIVVDPTRTEFWSHRAIALTFLKRHDEAVVAYSEALAVMDAAWGPDPRGEVDPRWVMYSNRACEHALAGRREPAFVDLARAVALRPEAGPDAMKDDYFAAYWNDPAFLAIAHGIQTVDPLALARRLRRAVGLYHRGEHDEAAAEASRALAEAAVLGDPKLHAQALRTAGNIATYLESPARGVALLTQATALGELAWPDAPRERAEAWHLLGAAHHAAGAWDEADTAYRSAEALRRAAGGHSEPTLAMTFGDRARLAANRGAPLAEVLVLTRQGTAICAEVAARGDDDAAREALDHATVLWSNAASCAADQQAWTEVITLATHAVEAFTDLLARDGMAQPNVLGGTVRTVQRAFHAGVEEITWLAMTLRGRLLAVEEPHAEAREEMVWWAGIRGAAHLEINAGRSAAEVAVAFGGALRGDPPAWFAEHAVLAPFTAELPRRLPRPGDMVLIAMALSAATDARSLDKALADLQALAVATRKMS